MKKFLWLNKLKALCRRKILLVILTMKKLLQRLQKRIVEINEKEFRVEIVIKRKGGKLISNGKVIIIFVTVW